MVLGMRAQSMIDHALAVDAVGNWQLHRSALSALPTPSIQQAS